MAARIDDRDAVCDIGAEEAVLSAILCEASILETVRDYVGPEDFWIDAHRLIFQAALDVDAADGRFDSVSLVGHLKAMGKLDRVGGTPQIAAILDAPVVPLANASTHAKKIRALAQQRRLAQAGRVIAAEGGVFLKDSVDEFAKRAEAAIAGAIESGATRDLPESIGTLAGRVVEEAAARGANAIGESCGLLALDAILNGWEPGLYIIAGRPGMGKTALAKSIQKGLARRTKKLAVFFSLEMPKEQLAQRMLCAEAKVPMNAFRSGTMTSSQRSLLVEAAGTLNQIPMVLTYRPGSTVAEVRSVVRRALREQRRKHGDDLQLGSIGVDYIQIMCGDTSGTREGEIASISRDLMRLSGEFGVPVLALSQLNRSVETRPNKRPTMADLRESGAIEQDAYAILFPYRDEYYNPETADQGIAEIGIGKNRNGEPGGKALLAFRGKYVLFENRGTPDEDFYGLA